MEEIFGRVLFEGYTVVNDNLVHSATGKSIPNLRIEDLDLSVRGYNVLKREGITSIADFIGMNTATIMNYRNMGAGTLSELLTKLKALEDGDTPDSDNAPADDMSIIAFRWQNKTVWDISLDKVPLSVRSRNRMDAMQVKFARQFLALENVSSISGLGQKSIDELVELKKQFLSSSIRGTEEERQRILELFMDAKTELQCLYTAKNEENLDSTILGCIFDLSAEERSLQRLLVLIKSLPVFSELIEIKVTAIIKESLFDGVTVEQISKAIGLDGDDIAIKNAVNKIVLNGTAYKEYDKVYFVYPSIMDVINTLTRKETEIMTRRLNGETLEAIAGSYDFTRERIRQIVEKSYEKLFVKNKHADIIDYVKEDKYKYFFETYSLEQDDFCEITSEAEYVWSYLTARYGNGERKLSDAVADERLTLHLRYGIQRFINKDFLIIGGQRIPLVKSETLNYVLSIYCVEDTPFDEFIKLYNDFIDEQNLSAKYKTKLRIEGENVRTVENKLNAAKNVLWKPYRRLRYYNMAEYDFSELLQTIDLKKYRNIELSSNKFFKEFPELMQTYDIRDEYELHNLLKKIYPDDGYVVFSRMPNIKFGEFDRGKAILDAICLLSPVSADDLVEFLSEEYGHRPDNLKSNWLPTANLYYNNGIYSIENKELPQADFITLKRLLTEDFYFIDEIKEIYKSISNHYDEELMSSYNLKRLGFTPYCNYVVRNTISCSDYFNKILTAENDFDATAVCKKLTSVSAFYSCLTALRQSRQIIEYEPYHFINIRKLNANGITEDDLRAFCNEVYAFVEEDKLFTIKTLFNDGFTSPLQNLAQSIGLGDRFFASILREDKRFSYNKINGGVLFAKGDNKITRGTLFEHIFGDREKMAAAESINSIYDYYGLTIEQDDISQAIPLTRLYYDPLSKTVYRNFETYESDVE